MLFFVGLIISFFLLIVSAVVNLSLLSVWFAFATIPTLVFLAIVQFSDKRGGA